MPNEKDNNLNGGKTLGQTDPNHTPTDPNPVRPSPTGSDFEAPAAWLNLDDVERIFLESELPRSRTLLSRYCRSGRLKGKKDAGPNGDEWFVDPASITRAITELKMIQRPKPGQTDPNQVRPGQGDASETSIKIDADPTQTKSDRPEPSPTGSGQDAPSPTKSDIDIFQHTYVIRLENQVEQLRGDLRDQVKVTQKIQQDSFDRLVELQRMVQVGQSQTLADFFLKAKDFLIGPPVSRTEQEADEDDEPSIPPKRRSK